MAVLSGCFRDFHSWGKTCTPWERSTQVEGYTPSDDQPISAGGMADARGSLPMLHRTSRVQPGSEELTPLLLFPVETPVLYMNNPRCFFVVVGRYFLVPFILDIDTNNCTTSQHNPSKGKA